MQVHWHEGLFLLPHHLQRLQRGALEQNHRERELALAYPYGVIEARLSQDDLEHLRLRFDRLRAIMPSGMAVDFPDEAELPVRDIKEALQVAGSVTVFLGVPLWFAARANAVVPGEASDGRAKILYRVVEREWADENTGSNSKPVLERRVNARLLLNDEDRSDLEVIPLLRIVRGTGEQVGLPRRDPTFVGPCLLLAGSSALAEMVRDLSGQIQASRSELILQINRGGFSLDTMRGLQLEQVLRLQHLNRAAVRLDAFLRAPGVTPFQIYLELVGLVSELSSLHPERDLFANLPVFNHDEPHPCFEELLQRIRLFLRGGVKPNFLMIPFEPKAGVLQASLEESHFTEPTGYFLGIRTKQDPLDLAQIVENEDRFKLMPGSLIGRAIRGILLKEERLPPLELPASSGLYYFRLLRSESPEVWDRIREEKVMAVRWSGYDEADYQVTLYLTLPANP